MFDLPAIRFYFSLRSPYAWLAAERLEHELAGLAYDLELVPLFPTSESFPNDPVRVPNKLRYVLIDVLRLAKQYALPIRLGAALETDWAKAHAAFLAARALGVGPAFMLAQFRARFCEARDVASDEVIRAVAQSVGIEADAIVAAARSPTFQAEVGANMKLGQERDRIFGVPSFVLRGELFWGHDRLSALRRALAEEARDGAC